MPEEVIFKVQPDATTGMQELESLSTTDALPPATERWSRQQFLFNVFEVAWIIVLLALLVPGLWLLFAGTFSDMVITGNGLADVTVIIIAMGPITFLTIIIHESGHLICGLLVRYTFRQFIAGPLIINKQEGRLHLRLNRNIWKYPGRVLLIPRPKQSRRSKNIFLTIGGPGANLVEAAICLYFIYLVYMGRIMVPIHISQVIWLNALIALCMFFLNCLPLRMIRSGEISDGAYFLNLVRGGPQVRRDNSVVWLSFSVQARRPCEWLPRLVQGAIAFPDYNQFNMQGCLLGYYHYLDTGDIEQAKHLLERTLALYCIAPVRVRKMRSDIALEAAYFEARYHHNSKAAYNWFKLAKRSRVTECTRLRAEAAILLSLGKKQEARKKIQAGLEAVKKVRRLGLQRMEEAWLKDMMELLGGENKDRS